MVGLPCWIALEAKSLSCQEMAHLQSIYLVNPSLLHSPPTILERIFDQNLNHPLPPTCILSNDGNGDHYHSCGSWHGSVYASHSREMASNLCPSSSTKLSYSVSSQWPCIHIRRRGQTPRASRQRYARHNFTIGYSHGGRLQNDTCEVVTQSRRRSRGA